MLEESSEITLILWMPFLVLADKPPKLPRSPSVTFSNQTPGDTRLLFFVLMGCQGDVPTLRCGDSNTKKKYVQVWEGNMKSKQSPSLSSYQGESFTRVSFWPDLARFVDEGEG